MPNIIEQQDLLKGLPDARLAMLLQNPVGDIPPFLVAAEAQRRQSIRQQFASEAPKESVVDTLTKQIANVPQNLNAQTQAPAMVPPAPPMQGVMALQQQQAMQNIAQQAMQQPQQMRGGGMVRRYQFGGVIAPPSRVMPYVEASSGFAPSVSEFSEFGPMPENSSIEDIVRMETETDPIRRRRIEEKEAADSEERFLEGVALPDVPVNFPPPPPKPRLRPENIARPEAGETEDKFRARLEALYAAQEPSDWEKAQKWFAMSEQFLDPRKTNMQSIVGAGQAFAQSAAEQARAQREMDLAREKAMLEYDMSERDRVRAAEAERAKLEYETQQKLIERRNPAASDVLRALDSLIDGINDRLSKMTEMGAMSDPAAIAALEAQKEQYMIQMAEILKGAGYGPSGAMTMDQLRALAGQ
jgi:hypothetical protein